MTDSMDTRVGPILITGAGGGVGVGLAASLLSAGCRDLLFHYRSRGDALLELLAAHDIDAEKVTYRGELRDEGDVDTMHGKIADHHGALFGLVNLAGSSSNGMSWKLSVEQFQEVVDSSLLSTFLCCRQFIPEMRELGRGRIINVSSVVAYEGAPGTSHYAAAKAGVIGFTRSIAKELAPRNVVASAIALGYLDKGLIDSIPEAQQEVIRNSIPAARFGTTAELAGLVEYLLGANGGYAGGQIFHLNGGLH